MNSGSFIIERIQAEAQKRLKKGESDAFVLHITIANGAEFTDLALIEHIPGNGVMVGKAKDLEHPLWIATAAIQSVSVEWE